MENVNSIPVYVYMDNTRTTCVDSSLRYIGCNFTKVRNEFISLTAGGNDCITWAAGDVWEEGFAPEGVEAVETVKINTPDGYLWLTPASYDPLVAACNACCTEVV